MSATKPKDKSWAGMMTERGSVMKSPKSKRKVDARFYTRVIATVGYPTGTDTQVELEYKDSKEIGHGSFGMVYVATLVPLEIPVAIKKVLQDKRYKNRELEMMRKMKHENIVALKYFFYSSGDKKDDLYLNLVLEFVPETVYKVSRTYAKNKSILPVLYIKLYMYQMFRALGYVHKLGICHRDIKPQNLLVNPETGVLKLCDFGSAKALIRGESNVAYICSRYYRAPELIFGATDYTFSIDMWSGGCVLAELFLGQPLFPGDSGVDQLVEIIKVLGTPSHDQIKIMNPNYLDFKFPVIKAHPWNKVFRPRTPPEAMELLSSVLVYEPLKRLSPLATCAHPFFACLRSPATTMLNNNPLPPLTNFTDQELSGETPALVAKLKKN